mmetsp:Transcript_11893/g.35723  ORF Transcript_11893/g.35723 Transcript_11893/m.35723 type:complete len:202 (-) Transcript_11893:171-776(-)
MVRMPVKKAPWQRKQRRKSSTSKRPKPETKEKWLDSKVPPVDFKTVTKSTAERRKWSSLKTCLRCQLSSPLRLPLKTLAAVARTMERRRLRGMRSSFARARSSASGSPSIFARMPLRTLRKSLKSRSTAMDTICPVWILTLDSMRYRPEAKSKDATSASRSSGDTSRIANTTAMRMASKFWTRGPAAVGVICVEAFTTPLP